MRLNYSAPGPFLCKISPFSRCILGLQRVSLPLTTVSADCFLSEHKSLCSTLNCGACAKASVVVKSAYSGITKQHHKRTNGINLPALILTRIYRKQLCVCLCVCVCRSDAFLLMKLRAACVPCSMGHQVSRVVFQKGVLPQENRSRHEKNLPVMQQVLRNVAATRTQ